MVGLHLWVDLWWVCPLQNRLTSGGCSHRGFFSCGELPPVTPFLVPPTRHAIETGLDFSDFPVCNYFLSVSWQMFLSVVRRCSSVCRLPPSAQAPRNPSLLVLLRSNFAARDFPRRQKQDLSPSESLLWQLDSLVRRSDHSLAKATVQQYIFCKRSPHICRSRFCVGNVPAHLIEWELGASREESAGQKGIFSISHFIPAKGSPFQLVSTSIWALPK